MRTELSMDELAKLLATEYHKEQYDRGGAPYIEHPAYVASLMDTDEEKAVAWLHDVIEGISICIDLLEKLFPHEVVEAIKALSRKSNEDYFDYIERVRANMIARKVKLADLSHNMQLNRIKNPQSADYERMEKYKKAIEILQG
jgi:(p)ppGpp synthase/HD superfamily hydrolase